MSNRLLNKLGSACFQIALSASSLSAAAATQSYYRTRQGSYGSNKQYLAETGLNPIISSSFLKTKKGAGSAGGDAETTYANFYFEVGQRVKELLIVDAAVQNKSVFFSQSKPGLEVVEIKEGSNGIVELFSILSKYHNLNAVHIVSHAQPGAMLLGGQVVNTELFEDNLSNFSSLNAAIKEGGDLLLYGCDLAEGKKGKDFLEIIKGNSHVDVAASINKTGNAAFGGDWELEIQKGDISTSPLPGSIAMKDFTGTLQFTGNIDFSQWADEGDFGTPPSIPDNTNVGQVYTSASMEAILQVQGELHGTGRYLTQEDLYSSNGEDGLTLSFTLGQTFTANSIDIRGYSGYTPRTLDIYSNLGNIRTGVTLTTTLTTIDLNSYSNYAGVTYIKIKETGTQNFYMVIDNFNVSSVGGAASNTAPIFTSAASASFAENTSASTVVLDVNANDGDGGANDANVSFSITGGADQSLFSIDSDDGELRFNSSPDADIPGDAGGNNVYDIEVTADDGEASDNTTVQNISITVTDVDDVAPTLTNQALAQTDADDLEITYQSNETGTLYYVVTTNSSTPTQAQILAGNDQSGTSTNVVSSGNAAVTVTGSNQTIALNGLTLASTTYHLFIYEEDAIGNESSVVTNSTSVDATTPTLINQALAQTDADDLEITYQSNETGTLYYVVTTNSSTPTQAQILAGNDQSGTSTNVVSSGNAAVTVTGSNQMISLNGLTLASTTYHLFIYEEDAIGNESSVVTNSTSVDATAPTLINQALAQTDADDLEITYQSNETGTLYYVVTTNSSTPTQAQILAGNDQSGTSTNVVSSGNAAVIVTGSNQTISLNGLTLASTTYHLFIYEEDAIGNESSVVTNSTSVDATAPTISSSTPADNATGVAVADNLTITFSENIQFGTGFFQVRQSSDDVPIFSIDAADPTNTSNVASISGAVLTINPGASFATGTGYYVFIHSGTPFLDLAGNAFVGLDDNSDLNFVTFAPNNEPSFSLPGSPNQTVSQSASATTVSSFASSISDGDSDTQTLTFNVSNDNNGIFSVQPDIDETTGNLTFTPLASTFGKATVTVSLSDDGGTASGGDDTSPNQSFDVFITPDNIKINEVHASAGADLEFIEVYNTGASATSLSGLVMVWFNGSDDLAYKDFNLTGSTNSSGFYLIGETNYTVVTPDQTWGADGLQNGPDAVAIYVGSSSDFTGTSAATVDGLVDVVVYGSSDDATLRAALGSPSLSPAGSSSNSISRDPDGTGSFVAQAATSGVTNDVTPPSGYSATIDQSPINAGNDDATSFTFASAELGSTYNYSFTSSGGAGSVTGSGVIATATDQITGIDLSGLSDGTITISVTLTDVNSNTGSAATDTETKETVAPTGYSVTIDQSPINAGNDDVASFTFASAELGSTYNYSFTSSGGAGSVTGSGVIVTATDQITGIDLSGLTDGTITISVTLTDVNGNTGSAATDTETKETVAPTGYSATIDQSPINAGNDNATSFTFASAEVGSTYNYSFTSSGGAGSVTGSGVIATATGQITGIDLSGLTDGTITISVTLTDVNGNTGSAATDTETKETVAPTGYSVTIDQSPINAGNDDVASFTFASAEVGSTYNYSFTSSGGAGSVTGSGVIATATDQITGIDLSGLTDGTITISVTLTDVNGNTGSAATDTETKDAAAPTGYSVAIDQSPINAGNDDATSFTFASAEVGSTYNYSFTSSGGAGSVTGSGVITTATDQITGIDLSGLSDGTISISVSLTDVNGNTGSATTDTETKDAVAPTLNPVALASSQTASEDYVDASHGTAGNLITLSFTADDDLSGAPVVGLSIGGTAVTATVNTGSAPNYTATYTLLGTENNGAVTFTIDFTDDAGNDGTQVTATTDGSSIEADFIAPTLTAVTLISDNGTNNQNAVGGNTVLLDIVSSEVLSALPAVAIQSGGVNVQGPVTIAHDNPGAPDFQNFNVTYAVDGTGSTDGVDRDADGTLSFTIDFVDDAGIAGTQVTSTTNDSAMEIDNTQPIVVVTDDHADPDDATDDTVNDSDNVTITATFTEANALGVTPLITIGTSVTSASMTSTADPLVWTYTWNVPAGDLASEVVSISASDAAGNVLGTQTNTNAGDYEVDNTDPSTTSFARKTPTDQNTNADAVTYLATFSEDVTGVDMNDFTAIGVTGTSISVSQVTASTYDVTVSGGDLPGYNGLMALNFNAPSITDLAGNALPNSEPATDDLYNIDNAAPTISISTPIEGDGIASASESSDVEISGMTVGVEDGQSVTVSFSDGISTAGPAAATVTSNAWTASLVDISALTEGTITVTADVSDLAGNAATQTSQTITLDQVAPTLSSSSPVDDATDAILDTDITLTFNEDISFGTGNIQVIDLDDGSSTTTIDVTSPGAIASISGSVLTINPSSDLRLNVSYAVQIAGTAITDLGGNAYGGISDNTTLNFTTINVQVGFTSSTSSGTESDATAAIQVDLSQSSALTTSVDYAITGTATGSGTDYTLADGTLTFAPGSTSEDITIASIVDDAILEVDETVILTLSNPTNAGLNTTTVHTYTITNNDAATVTIADITADENSGTQTITATLDIAVDGGFAFDVFTTDGTATVADSDYSSTAGSTLTFTGTAGETQTLNLQGLGDTKVETDETFTIAMRNLGFSSFTTSEIDITDVATYTITNDDVAIVTIADISAAENAGTQTITATLDVAVDGGFAFDVFTTDGTATVTDSDYSSTAGSTLTFSGTAGETQTLNLGGLGDTKVETDETFTIAMRNLGFSSFTTSEIDITDVATYTITNDDAAVVTIADISAAENAGTQTITATLDVAVDGGFAFDVFTTDGTATVADSDYSSTAGSTLTFSGIAGETQTLNLGGLGDTKLEADETFTIAMRNLGFSSFTTSEIDITDVATYTITNDDAAVVTIADISAAENAGTQTITATLDVAVDGGFAFDVFTTDGTATVVDSDYSSTAGSTLTFAGTAGETQTLNLQGLGDTKVEADETFTIAMRNLGFSSFTTSEIDITDVATYTITNDDAAVVTIADIMADENSGTQTITATLDVAVDGGFAFDVFTMDGTATVADGDYSSTAGSTLTFAGTAGETQTLSLGGLGDTKLEADETFTIGMQNLGSTSFATSVIDITDVATYTITNDDAAAVTIADVSGNEDDGAITVTATLDFAVQGGFTVDMNSADGSALTSDSDYTALVGETLTFSGTEGETQTFTFTPTSDTKLESDETVTLSQSNLAATSLGVVITDGATVTITNDDAAVVTIADITADENSGTQTITATLDVAVDGGFSFDVFTTDGTATVADSDYSSTAGSTLTFAGTAGETQTLSLGGLGDTKLEFDETFTIGMQNLGSTSFTTSQIDLTDVATYTITNDDSAIVTIEDVSADENSGTQTITATLDVAVAGGFSFDVFTSDGTATVADSDYSSTAGSTLTFAGTAGETQTLSLGGLGDTKLEADETFTIGMQNLGSTSFTSSQIDLTDIATYTITNDDAAAVTIEDVSGNEDEGAVTITATLDFAVQGGFTVDVSTTDGTAMTTDGDYTALVGETLTFSGTAGETQTFTFTPISDTKLESDETVTLSQSNLTATSLGVVIADGATVTITNDDAAAVTIADVSGSEDDGAITVIARLDFAVQGGFTVDMNTADGSALTSDSDYTALLGETLTFAGTEGEMQTFTIMPTSDTKLETDETLTITQDNLASTTLGVVIADGATVAITNDDTAAVTIADVSGNEDDGAITITAILDFAVQGGFTLDVGSADGTATLADNDYAAIVGETLTFVGTAGEAQTFSIVPAVDEKDESDETVTISQSNLSGTSLSVIITDEAMVTFIDDDSTPVITSGQEFDVNEDAADGFVLGTVAATDADAGTTFLSWTITNGNTNNAFSIDATTGELTVSDMSAIDFGTTPTFTLTLTVSDGTNTSAEETVLISTLDTEAPTVALTSDVSSVTNSLAVEVTATFSEVVNNFELADINVSNGTASNLSTSDNIIYTFLIAASSDANVSISLAADVAEDDATNGNEASNRINYFYDGTVPTVELVTSADAITGETGARVMITFSEMVTGLELADIQASSGTLSNLTGSGFAYNVDVTDLIEGTAIITVPSGAASDAGENGNTEGSVSWEVDLTGPSGFTVNILNPAINTLNEDNFKFRINGAEPRSTFNYTITSTGGGTPVEGTGELNGNGQGGVLQNIDVTSLEDGVLTLSVEMIDEFGNLGSIATDIVDKITEEDIPEGFSPNGDGIDDNWIIPGIEDFPDNKVAIFNRYGTKVWEIEGYDNTGKAWGSEANVSGIFGNAGLPDGTYFYVITFPNNKNVKTKSGFVILKR
ncbi:MAG: DUF4347 domain-containing protein [Cyclobacteriaceae bacterium]